jgi:hypothetical protein
MAIGKISGQMLQSDLVRQGVDLAIDSISRAEILNWLLRI